MLHNVCHEFNQTIEVTHTIIIELFILIVRILKPTIHSIAQQSSLS